MKITTREEVIKEIDIEIVLPYYSKDAISCSVITENEECIVVTFMKGRENIGWTVPENILRNTSFPSSKEEFEKAFEETLITIKNKVYAR